MCAEEKNSSSSASDSSRGTEEVARVLEELRGANGRLVIAGIRMQELADQAETARHHAEAARAEAEAAAADNARLYQNAHLEIERRTRAEQALREGWQRFQALVEASAQIVWTTDPKGAVVEDSPSWRAFTGQTYEQRRGFGWLAALHPDDRERISEQWQRVVAEGTPLETEYRIRHVSGDWRWMLTRAVPVLNPAGSVREWVGMNLDITEHKLAEDALRLSHAELESQVQQRTASLRQLASHLQNAQDEERRRIARELHDSVGQYLVSVKMNLAQVNQQDLQRARAVLSESDQLLEVCLAEIRTISHLLHPPLLDESGLASAATWYVEGFGKRSGIQTNLDISSHIERLPQPVEMALFRSLQESLTNVHRHSGSPNVDVRIEISNGQVGLTVRDYGRGITPKKLENSHTAGANLGVGLTGMRERVTELGGSLQVLRENPGTLVIVTVPVRPE
jgi:PAS domain S-box-containing protein